TVARGDAGAAIGGHGKSSSVISSAWSSQRDRIGCHRPVRGLAAAVQSSEPPPIEAQGRWEPAGALRDLDLGFPLPGVVAFPPHQHAQERVQVRGIWHAVASVDERHPIARPVTDRRVEDTATLRRTEPVVANLRKRHGPKPNAPPIDAGPELDEDEPRTGDHDGPANTGQAE